MKGRGGQTKFDMFLEAQGKQTFWWDIPVFAGISRGRPKSREVRVCVQLLSTSLQCCVNVLEKAHEEKACEEDLDTDDVKKTRALSGSGTQGTCFVCQDFRNKFLKRLLPGSGFWLQLSLSGSADSFH